MILASVFPIYSLRTDDAFGRPTLYIDDGVHGVGGSCLLAALGRHVHHYLAGIEAFSVEELERVVAAVLQSLGVTQLLPQSQRPSVDGVSLAACTS